MSSRIVSDRSISPTFHFFKGDILKTVAEDHGENSVKIPSMNRAKSIEWTHLSNDFSHDLMAQKMDFLTVEWLANVLVLSSRHGTRFLQEL
jgi:hypothetical protein